MAHERKRHILEVYNQLLKFSPIVGIFGHRQVGKSTFIVSSVNEYRTLDDIDTLLAAHENTKQFIQSKHKTPLAIDECQLEPKLFPTLKELVRTHKQPGQFVLSGSVRFTSRKVIRESLAGRIALLELLPFSVSELMGDPLTNAVNQLFQHKKFSTDSLRVLHPQKKQKQIQNEFNNYLVQGGLPGLCFIRNQALKKNALSELHDLILARDLKLVADIKTPITTLKKLMVYIAVQGVSPYNAAEVKRTIGLAQQTQKKILSAMESIFLIRRIPVPLRKKEIILLEDQFEEFVYSGNRSEKSSQIESAVYRNVRTQFAYRLEKNTQFESYLTRDHARVPIVIRDENLTLGIIVIQSEKPSISESRSAGSFLSAYSNAKILFLSTNLIEPKILNERSMLISLYSVI